jgi:leucyl-tRNA synthetase
MLNPLAPYVTEELWSTIIGEKESIAYAPWPKYDEEKCAENEIKLPIQVNGKLKGLVNIKIDATQIEVLEALKTQLPALAELKSKKIVYVPNKILNIIV